MMDWDFVVIGSGFGGSVSALRLTEKGYRLWAEAMCPVLRELLTARDSQE